MSELINALDKHNNKQLGENLHYEYKWNNNIQEKMVQLYFQLVRTQDKKGQNEIAKNYSFKNIIKYKRYNQRKRRKNIIIYYVT